jgi:hypothetical protein
MAFASAVILGSKSRGTHVHILLSHIRDFHNLEGQDPLFIYPRNRVAQLYPQALGSPFIASYYSRGYGGGIRTRLQTGADQLASGPRYIQPRGGLNSSSIVVTDGCLATAWMLLKCLMVSTGRSLPSRCSETVVVYPSIT